MVSEVTRSIDEQLSAFLDGELPEEELALLVRRLERDESLRARLARFAAVGGVLRDEPIIDTSTSFRADVMTAIEQEGDSPMAMPEEKVAADSGRPRFVAAAAAVVVAVFAGYMFTAVEQPEITGQELAQAAIVAPPEIVPAVEVRSVPTVARSPMRLNRDRMTSYLISHGEYTRQFPGALSDSRMFVQQASFEE